MSQEIADALARAGGSGERKQAGRIRDYVGKTLSFVSIKEVPNTKYGGTSVLATVLDDSGNELDLWTTGNVGKQLREVASHLPLDLKVVTFTTEQGNGYAVELA